MRVNCKFSRLDKKMSSRKIYGLTLRQWTVAAAIIIGAILFGCRSCYNFVRDRVAPTGQNANQKQPNQEERRKPPGGVLTNDEAARRYLMFGNPSNAAQSDANNYLLVNPYYAVSYNRLNNTPNWVAWTITQADLGSVDRANDFRPNTDLPNGFYRVTPTDYTGGGFDRGHVCPSADRTATPEANSATFLMTNMTPQTPDLNRNVWESLESYSRTLVKNGADLYVIAGVYGSAGKLKNKVNIPTNDWKIIVVAPNGLENINNINANTRIIAVDMPNINGIKGDDWRKYRTTISQIEQKTNLNLLTNLPANVQSGLKNKTDNQ